ncbi:MAG: DNA-deoxyinosine glycosylase [Alphaproteobacteria bacterium]
MRAAVPRIRSFAPIADKRARTLILGSMPGVASLCARQYYAHRQNQFWRIMGRLLSMPPDLPYAERVERLRDGGIAVWDVLHSCVRDGSLDTAIADETPNDFAKFFRTYREIDRVFFNGAKAETSFRRHGLQRAFPDLKYVRLPSTSPAHAGMNWQRKRKIWAREIFSR